jgi:hypothetical protein
MEAVNGIRKSCLHRKTVNVRFEVSPKGGIPKHKVEEIRAGLRELGLEDSTEIVE